MTPRTTGTFFSFATQSLAAVVLMAACHSGGGSSTRLMSIAVTPTNPSIASGTSAQLVATGTYSDSRTKDITAQATWSSSDPAAVVVSNAAGSVGLAQGLVPGDVTVSATFMGISGSTGLTVSSAALVAIEVTPGQPSIALGTSLDFVATGVFTDATTQDLTAQAVWESSDASAATVANGLATSVGVGSTTISATFSGITGSVDLEVTAAVVVAIQVTPTDPSIALGTQQVFTATGVFSDATTQDLTAQAAWSSSSPAAAVSNAAPDQGLAQSHAVGSATITATFSGLSGSSTLTVTGAALVSIAVTPTNPSIALGTQQAFTATGTFTDATVQDLSAEVTWSSSDATVVAVSNADGSRGLASSISVGDTTITASLDGIDGSTMLTVSSAALVSIEVSPAAPSIALGYAQPFVATGTYTDGSTQDVTDEVTWSSSSASTASVSNADGSRGLATSMGVGSTTISAMFAGISGSTTLAVSNAVLVSLEVSPDSFSIAKGTEQAFSALGVFSDGTRQDLTGEVTWASSDESVARVSNAADSAGLAKGVGVGSASISATLDGIGGSTGLDVTSAVLVSIDVLPFAPSFAKGTDLQLHAVGTYSDESEQDLTADVAWSSSDALVAVVSNAAGSRGIATALAVGSSTVTASFSGISGTADLAVSPAVLDAIWIDPTDPSVPVGMTRSFTATGVFSDASTQDLTARVTWSSSDATVVAVSNAAGSEGLAKGLSTGSVTISASLAGVTGATSMSVTSIVLVSIDLSPADPFVPSGYSIHLQATGNYSDGSAVDLTKLAVWTSSATVFATVSNAIGTEGKLSGRSSGSTTVTATYSGVSSSTVVTVTNESLVSISVSPSPVTLDVGETVQMTAMGLFSGGTLVDVTGSVRWFSSNKHVASVGNALSKGLVTAQKAGTMTIRARKGNRFDTAPGSVL